MSWKLKFRNIPNSSKFKKKYSNELERVEEELAEKIYKIDRYILLEFLFFISFELGICLCFDIFCLLVDKKLLRLIGAFNGIEVTNNRGPKIA